MALDISLKIYMPEKPVVDKKVHRVVLPYDGKTLTVIKDRAPTLLPLDMGAIQILDENDQPVEIYYIANGAADIHDDTCTILTEAAYNRHDLSLAKIREMNAEFANPFFNWLEQVFDKEESIKR